MATAAELWLRVPVLPRAVVVGLAVAAAGTVPWAVLVSLNLKHLSAVPWAVPVMAAYLSLFWLYFVRMSDGPARQPRPDVPTLAPMICPETPGDRHCSPGCSDS